MNIRNEADRNALEARGFKWVTVLPRGDNKGLVMSKHRTYEAANVVARNNELAIVEIAEGRSF